MIMSNSVNVKNVIFIWEKGIFMMDQQNGPLPKKGQNMHSQLINRVNIKIEKT